MSVYVIKKRLLHLVRRVLAMMEGWLWGLALALEKAVVLEEMAVYEKTMRTALEVTSLGKWVVVQDRKLIGTYDTFQDAANVAIERFGRGPYLIKEVGDGFPKICPLVA